MIFRVATLADADDLAPRLRAADRREIAVLSGVTALTALRTSLRRSSVAQAVVIDGQVEALYGVSPDGLGRAAAVWALGSDVLPTRRWTLIKEMKRFLDDAQARHGRLYNIVDEENAQAIALLRRLGFKFGATLPAIGGGRAISFGRG